MSEIFDRRWILDTNALSYIADRDQCHPHGAALILQRLIVDQKVGMRPIDSDEDWSFFRFAIPEPNGGAFNVKSLKRVERFEVNAEELLIALPPLNEAVPKQPHGGGAPVKYDWVAVKMVLKTECKKRDMPTKENDDLEWQLKADVRRFLHKKFEGEWKDGGPSDTRLNERLGPMLKQIKDELTGN
jgi:hypothetical protein